LTRAVREASHSVCGEVFVSVSVGSAFHPAHGLTAEELLFGSGPQHVPGQGKTLFEAPAGDLIPWSSWQIILAVGAQ